MRPSTKGLLLSGVALVGTWVLGSYVQGRGQEATKVVKTTDGGLLATTTQHQFKAYFYSTGVRLFPLTNAGQPVDISKVAASATFFHPNSTTPWFSRPLRSSQDQVGSLVLSIGLGNAPATGGKVRFEVTGLADASEPEATFTAPLEFVPQQVAHPSTQPTAPRGDVAAVPRYVYAPGYYGYGYYPYSSPDAASPPASAYHTYASPSGHYRGDGGSVGVGHRDWSTGRENSLAKPWMRAMD